MSALSPPVGPVACADAGSMNPNLADLFRFTSPKRLALDNLELRVESCLSATDERACAVSLGHSFVNAMLLERSGADGAGDCRFCAAAAAYLQSRFPQAICRIERLPTQ